MDNLQPRYHCDSCEMFSDHRENFPHKMDCKYYVPKDPIDYEAIIKVLGNYFYEDEITLGQSLLKLLLGVWEQEEGFSGKRPFGNSGWKGFYRDILAGAGFIKCDLDEYGNADIPDSDERKRVEREMDRIIKGTIEYIFAKAGIE